MVDRGQIKKKTEFEEEMAIEYKVREQGKYIEAIATQTLTAEEVCEYITAIERNEGVKPEFVELFDVSGITQSQINGEGLEQIVKKIGGGPKGSRGKKIAIVVSSGTSFDRAKFIQQRIKGEYTVIVFNNRSTAEIWLGVRKAE